MAAEPRVGIWPGIVATIFLAVATSFWTFWGVSEMFFEGWGLPFPMPLAYLIPAGIMVGLSLLALRFPAVGGIIVLTFGTWFTWWWWRLMYGRGQRLLGAFLSTVPASAILILVGLLFLLEARRRRQLRDANVPPNPNRWRRHWRYLVVLGPAVLIGVVVTATQLGVVLSRHDDHIRTARVIDGKDVRLLWAPAGPGWNWKQPQGWILGWDHLAIYGRGTPGVKLPRREQGRTVHAVAADMAETGLCAYLTEDGTALSTTRLGLWRMPTVREIVGSLSRDGLNAGCTWKGERGFSPCRTTPDKESPLWAPNQSPIYYWAADEVDRDTAWYVSYNGSVLTQPKDFANPRHGYRCVREVRR